MSGNYDIALTKHKKVTFGQLRLMAGNMGSSRPGSGKDRALPL